MTAIGDLVLIFLFAGLFFALPIYLIDKIDKYVEANTGERPNKLFMFLSFYVVLIIFIVLGISAGILDWE